MFDKLIHDVTVKLEFGPQQRQRFYIKLGQLLDNGVNLDAAISQIQASASQKSGSLMPKLYNRWRKNIANGMNLGQCLALYVPSSEALLIETGSNSGKLSGALRNASDALEGQNKVRKAILGSLAYPFVLFCMLIAALVLASFKVIPTFEQIIPSDQWTGIPYVVSLVATFIRGYILFALGGLVLLFLAVFASFPRWTGRLRVKFDRFVPWSIYRVWQGSAFLLALSSIMSSGVKLDEVSLGRVARNADPYLKQRVRAVSKRMMSGDNLGEALYNTGYRFPDDDIIRDLQIYARIRGFDQNLIRITRSWLDSLVDTVTINMRVVNFTMLVLITVVISMLITAFYDIFSQIQAQTQH